MSWKKCGRGIFEVKHPELLRMDRRESIRWMMTAAVTLSVYQPSVVGDSELLRFIGTDPNLLHPIVPWARTFTAEELRAVTILCDLIIPHDDRSPSASAVGVPDFLDEWVSAPYPEQLSDRKQIRDGLVWLDAESHRRFGRGFVELTEIEQRQICDDICRVPATKPEWEAAVEFFAKFRNLTAGGFYTTKEGMKDIQYVGNVALPAFKGPPPEVLAHLKLT